LACRAGPALVIEIAETFTDPGAESRAGLVQYGAWFDYQGWEIGDKCAWVGDGLQVPGAPFNMIGNDGAAYPVQTLWSNTSLNGIGSVMRVMRSPPLERGKQSGNNGPRRIFRSGDK